MIVIPSAADLLRHEAPRLKRGLLVAVVLLLGTSLFLALHRAPLARRVQPPDASAQARGEVP